VLVRHGLVPARRRKRRRQDYKRWQREAPMQLWQLDITGSVFLTDGTELKLISGIDDHSRFCVIAAVVRRATARAVCRAFIAAMRAYGIPDEVLSDNGKQFTGRFGKPRPAEVLFERICRRNGISQLLTKPFSPTTTGKVERWHQTLQHEFLNDAGPFQGIEGAQAAIDAWREEYNQRRPHQSLDMACPADKFQPRLEASDGLELWAPADLEPIITPGPALDAALPVAEPVSWPDAIEIDRVVPPSGNMTAGPQQFWLGTSRTGQAVRFWIDTTTVHLSIAGWRIKTVPSRLSAVDLARLRQNGARQAGPPPAGNAPGALAATSCVEVQRWSTPPGSSAWATRSSRSAPRWPGSVPGSASTARSCTSSPRTASCGAPCPAPSRPASGTVSRASASPGQTRCHSPAWQSSGGYPAAAASRSRASASRLASATLARPSPLNSAAPACGSSISMAS
jgi:transposase InsO family protein